MAIRMGKKIELDAHVPPYTKINSKLIKDVNVKKQTLKLLVENIAIF